LSQAQASGLSRLTNPQSDIRGKDIGRFCMALRRSWLDDELPPR
jgi:hypothetical protein